MGKSLRAIAAGTRRHTVKRRRKEVIGHVLFTAWLPGRIRAIWIRALVRARARVRVSDLDKPWRAIVCHGMLVDASRG